MEQIWKPAPGFNGYYEISSRGLCRRVKPTANGVPNREIAPKVTRGGYHHYCLWRDGEPNWRMAHRLVVEAFLDQIPDGKEVNHKNGVRDDNRVENLEVVTRSENCLHRHRVLNCPTNFKPMRGAENGSAKLTEEIVRSIRADRDDTGQSYAKLGKKYDITPRMAWLIVKRKAWGHVT